MACVVQLTGLSHNDFHFWSQCSFYKSNNSTILFQNSGRKVFCLSMNFGFHLAVGPPSGSSILWLKKIPDFVQKYKSFLYRVPTCQIIIFHSGEFFFSHF
jgi:hypothetical protein